MPSLQLLGIISHNEKKYLNSTTEVYTLLLFGSIEYFCVADLKALDLAPFETMFSVEHCRLFLHESFPFCSEFPCSSLGSN